MGELYSSGGDKMEKGVVLVSVGEEEKEIQDAVGWVVKVRALFPSLPPPLTILTSPPHFPTSASSGHHLTSPHLTLPSSSPTH
ncbi:hypothetical protein Pmani_006383 [Petrolisthes manimaculis]|uniref:Uncharacterized protein n=1 Tax=Petrolisthes manimaculis TaxID=1843537 RepID=A0AAE1QAR5_9EUCA|nr:hypothetical protein Pmani_006383 [Petrolisthes manimaculis]